MKYMKIGLQMYSVRNSLKEDPLGTIQKVAEIGYKNLEFANLDAAIDFGCGFGVGANELKAVLDEYDLKSVSSHFMPLNDTNLKAVIDYHSVIETKYLIAKLSEPYVDGERALKLAKEYNFIGKTVQDYGMRFCYYPRFFDYIYRFDGTHTLLEVIMENTDPDLVDLEIDVYWLYRWGMDPVEIMKQYGDRIKMIHQKDIPETMRGTINPMRMMEKDSDELKDMITKVYSYNQQFFDPKFFTEIGLGMLDIQNYITASETYTKAEYNFLEQDYSQHSELESIRISMDAFKTFSGITF